MKYVVLMSTTLTTMCIKFVVVVVKISKLTVNQLLEQTFAGVMNENEELSFANIISVHLVSLLKLEYCSDVYIDSVIKCHSFLI